MRLSIAHLRAAGLSAEQIVKVLEEADAERREKERIKKRNQRACPRDGGDNRDRGTILTVSPFKDTLSKEEGSFLIERPLTSAPRARVKFVYPLEFVAFWQQYPLKVGKDAALKAWEKVIKSGKATADEIVAGAIRYAADPHREDSFTKHGATWLNAGCFSDGPLPKRWKSLKEQNRETMDDLDSFIRETANEAVRRRDARAQGHLLLSIGQSAGAQGISGRNGSSSGELFGGSGNSGGRESDASEPEFPAARAVGGKALR
jgi:hypothetical protein